MNGNDASVTGKPARRAPWNKGKFIGTKPPSARATSGRFELRATLVRDPALFNLAIDSRMRVVLNTRF